MNWYGVSDLALTCGSEPVMDSVCCSGLGSSRTGRVLDAGSDREDRSSDVCYVDDTQQSLSERDDDSILHIDHLCTIRVTSRHLCRFTQSLYVYVMT